MKRVKKEEFDREAENLKDYFLFKEKLDKHPL